MPLDIAYKVACERLAGISDIEQQCRNSGAQCQVSDSGTLITLCYLNQLYQIRLPDISISPINSNAEVPLKEKLLLMHYFVSAKGTPVANKLITFRDLPEGTIYFPTFSQRTVKPLLGRFGKTPDLLVETAKILGGRKVDYGDAAVTIDAFPRVPITIVLWQGDDEFPPEGNILFDATITDYMPTEDITVLTETIAWKLIRHQG